jgi:hypothetical protein
MDPREHGLPYFAVLIEKGPAWRQDVPLNQQADWSAHVKFANSLEADGTVRIGGPIKSEGPQEALLIVRCQSAEVIRRRYESEDPWIQKGVIRIGWILPWESLLGNPP